ncbi:MAG: T9SS type A sorting domain-containing protein [Bacteroidetes bacterium]|nr:T9SS type A sorting domain-containing protein [Bacteroidota bacterium]
MKFLSTILLLIATIHCSAQITFERSWGGVGYQDGQTICKTSDGGFAIAGVSSSDTSTYLDIIITKTNEYGDSLWTKTYGGSSANDFPSAIVETHDGGFLISATTYSLGFQAPTLSDWWILRTDANGDTLWTKIIRHVNNDRMQCISENDDNTILCCGWWSIGGWAKGTLLKLSETGDSLWSAQMGSSGNSYAQVCKQNYDGNYIVAGAILNGTYGASVFEFDTAGNYLASHTYNMPSIAENVNSIDHLPQGGYIISAKAGTTPYYDVMVIKTDNNFDSLSSQIFNDSISMSDFEAKFPFALVPDSGYIYGGTVQVGAHMDAVLYRIDQNDNYMWTRYFNLSGECKADAVLAIDTTGFIFSGQSSLTTNISAELYLVRTDENGLVLINSTSEFLKPTSLVIYPNPTQGMISWKSEGETIDEIRIISVNGAIVYSKNCSEADGRIQLPTLAPGIYTIEFQSKQGVRRSKFHLN